MIPTKKLLPTRLLGLGIAVATGAGVAHAQDMSEMMVDLTLSNIKRPGNVTYSIYSI